MLLPSPFFFFCDSTGRLEAAFFQRNTYDILFFVLLWPSAPLLLRCYVSNFTPNDDIEVHPETSSSLGGALYDWQCRHKKSTFRIAFLCFSVVLLKFVFRWLCMCLKHAKTLNALVHTMYLTSYMAFLWLWAFLNRRQLLLKW